MHARSYAVSHLCENGTLDNRKCATSPCPTIATLLPNSLRAQSSRVKKVECSWNISSCNKTTQTRTGLTRIRFLRHHVTYDPNRTPHPCAIVTRQVLCVVYSLSTTTSENNERNIHVHFDLRLRPALSLWHLEVQQLLLPPLFVAKTQSVIRVCTHVDSSLLVTMRATKSAAVDPSRKICL